MDERGSLRAPARPPAGSASGLSLVEVVVAIFLLAIVALAFGRTVVASLGSLSQSEARQQAYTAATRAIEQVRTLPFTSIALEAGDAAFTGTTFDPATGTLTAPGTAEPVVRVAGGLVTGEPFQLDAPIRMRTVVTRPDAANLEQVRVTVLAEFDRAGRTEVLRQSTLVNQDVEWGLAQPSFTVTPVTAGIQVERGSESCVDHQVQNLGTEDRYRVSLPTAADEPILSSRYVTRIYEVPTSGTPILRTAGQFTNTYPPAGRFTLRVCYQASANAESVPEFDLLVRSEFAEAIAEDALELEALSQRLIHGLQVETERTVHLASRGAESRDPVVPYATTLDPPTPTALANFATNVDELPGLTLPRAGGDSQTWAARWHHEVGPERDVTGARLRLWYSAPAVLRAEASVDATIALRIDLRRLTPTGGVTELHGSTTTLTVPPTTWQPVTLDLPVPRTAFEAGDVLEVAVACHPSSASDCALAFGTTAYPATLRITFP